MHCKESRWYSETGEWYSETRIRKLESGIRKLESGIRKLDSGIRKLGSGIRKLGSGIFGNWDSETGSGIRKVGVVFGNWYNRKLEPWNWKPPGYDHRTLVWFFSIHGALQQWSHFLSKERIIAASSCAKPRVRRPKHTLCKSASRTSLRVKLPHSMAAEICSLKLPSVSFRPNYSIYWPDGVAVLIPYCFEGVAALIPHEDQLKLRSY